MLPLSMAGYPHKKRQIGFFYTRLLLFRAVLFFLSVFAFLAAIIDSVFLRPLFFLFRACASLRLPHIKYFVIGVLCGLVAIMLFQSYTVIRSLPNPRLIGKMNYPVSTKLFDRTGRLLYEIYREQNRTPVKLADLPPYVVQATIATEDKDFYRHNGVSLFGGIVRAVKDNVLRHSLQGGSTITQQLVKSSLLTSERTIIRKIKEIILALWAERIYSKAQILEMYLNQVPYGGLSYGIEEAAQTYFGKEAQFLSLAQAAYLAGLPQAPSVYSAFNNPPLAKSRRDEVLRKLKEQGYIDKIAYKQAIAAPLVVNLPKTPIKAPHFVFYVKSLLENEYGIRTVEEGGLRVITTLDLNVQEKAEAILREELLKIQNLHVENGAVLITVPQTGDIVAMVGGRDYFESPGGAFNVTLAPRQPGSLIKPIMYSLALSRGFTAATILDDTPVVFAQPGGKPYVPVNYDNRFHGKIPLRFALANSYNVPAVKTLNAIGVSPFIDHARKMGITTWTHPERYGLALTLGGAEVRMIDMAEAFSSFANDGYKVTLNPFIKVENHEGEVFFEKKEVGKEQVISSAIAFIISDILSDNDGRRQAFGASSALTVPRYKVAVKTGTTNAKRDNWTIGYTPDILTAVWVGNNDNSPMNPYLTSGITGAAPIWNKVMQYLFETGADTLLNPSGFARVFSPPDDVVVKKCYFGKIEYFIKGTEKDVSCRAYSISPVPKPTP